MNAAQIPSCAKIARPIEQIVVAPINEISLNCFDEVDVDSVSSEIFLDSISSVRYPRPEPTFVILKFRRRLLKQSLNRIISTLRSLKILEKMDFYDAQFTIAQT